MNYRVFLSHSEHDAKLAAALKSALAEALGFAPRRVFVSSDGSIRAGEKIPKAIANALQSAQAVVVLLTPNSLSARWVHFEAGGAYFSKKKLFVAAACGVRPPSFPSNLSEYHVKDLRRAQSVRSFLKDIASLLKMPFTRPSNSAVAKVVKKANIGSDGCATGWKRISQSPNPKAAAYWKRSCIRRWLFNLGVAMPIRHAIWKVGEMPEALPESSLVNEQLLEKMILAAPQMLSDEWMFIGQQEPTGLGGRVDLLAIAPDCTLILIELKRDRTPREVVAQAIDYASWVEKLETDKIAEIYGRFAKGRDLAADFQNRFGLELNEELLNESHQIIVVAESLDPSTERIVAYLSDRGISINVLCFQVFSYGNAQLLSRTWLLDPVRTQVSAAAKPGGPAEPWNGEFYCSFGVSESRSWDEAVKYDFICAGGGLWYTKTLQLLNADDRVWVRAPGYGFVGVCRVKGQSQPAASFRVKTRKGELPALDVLKEGHYHRKDVKNRELCEYFVPVKWLQTVPLDQAVDEIGLFGNQNTICQPTAQKWRHTVDRLKEKFPDFNN